MIRLSIFLLLIINNSVSYSQKDFLSHLSTHQLKQEHRQYIEELSQNIPQDSIAYFRAKYFLQYADESEFNKNYLLSKPLCTTDTALMFIAGIKFLSFNFSNTSWLTELEKSSSVGCRMLLDSYKASLDPNVYSIESFPLKLQRSFSNYQKSFRKKPFIAAVLSTIIPGSGQFYANKKKSSVLLFSSNIAFGVQAIESIFVLGMAHPFSLVTVGLFSAFYLSNIYGSAVTIKKTKQELQKQFLIDASDYYNLNYHTTLY